MNYEKVIRGLKTVRDFKDKSVEDSVLNAMVDFGCSMSLPSSAKVNVKVVYTGTDVIENLKGKVGYFGNLIEAPHYILVYGENSEAFRVNAGYVIEAMRFKAQEEGLGTCWLEASNDKGLKFSFDMTENDHIAGILAVGIPYDGYFKQDIEKTSDRNSVSEIVYADVWGNEVIWDELYQWGVGEAFSLVRFAPSSGNQQPWKFILREGKIYLFMVNKGELTDLESGIIRLYLEKAFMNLHIQRQEDKLEENVLAEEMNVPKEYILKAVYSI